METNKQCQQEERERGGKGEKKREKQSIERERE